MIIKRNGKYHLMSKDGTKHLGGPYETEQEAIDREKQVNYFKYKDVIDAVSSKKKPAKKD